MPRKPTASSETSCSVLNVFKRPPQPTPTKCFPFSAAFPLNCPKLPLRGPGLPPGCSARCSAYRHTRACIFVDLLCTRVQLVQLVLSLSFLSFLQLHARRKRSKQRNSNSRDGKNKEGRHRCRGATHEARCDLVPLLLPVNPNATKPFKSPIISTK